MSELENTEVLDQEDTILDEDTSNAGTIAGNPTISRSELMAMMVNYANSLGNKEELAAFVAKLPNAQELTKSNDDIYNTVTQYAKGDAGKNKAGINSASAPSEPMKALPSMKEDLAMLFGEDSDLSEDFRVKTEALFEAAVATRVGLELAKIEEEFDAKLEEEVSALKEEMEENIDAYLNYALSLIHI